MRVALEGILSYGNKLFCFFICIRVRATDRALKFLTAAIYKQRDIFHLHFHS